jgi:hypothetical protein
LGQWKEAHADFARAVETQPNEPEAWRGLALVQLSLNQPEDSRQTCTRFLERFAHPSEAAAVGLAFGPAALDPLGHAVLASGAGPRLEVLLAARAAAVRTAVLRRDATADPARLLPWAGTDPLVRGAVICRAGRHDDAVQALADRRDAAALLFRALGEHGRGNSESARAALAEAERWLDAPGAGDPKQTNAERLPWDQRVEVGVLRAEVRAVLRVAKP